MARARGHRAAGSVHRLGDTDRYLVSHSEDVEYVLTHEDLFSGGTEERMASFDHPGPEGVPRSPWASGRARS